MKQYKKNPDGFTYIRTDYKYRTKTQSARRELHQERASARQEAKKTITDNLKDPK